MQMNRKQDTDGNPSGADGNPDSEPGKSRETAAGKAKPLPRKKEAVAEIGGPKGPDPTRYGDWERKGRCIDF